ncbi:hypothetical protein BHK98_09230 [Hornefia porci]|uniref:Uncharacterized protein n=2 Tax=Hornefia porci TaxID=2652292 RepID=A0A1Q9JJ50_9FIRM|nr:hypothetical protein BHK98_09230 [Hornefia porci]
MRERTFMATISDYDEKIEKKKDEIVRLEARRKALLRKERERERKWKTAFQNTIGEIVVQAVGCGWQELDLELFQAWLEEAIDGSQPPVVLSGSAPEDAKKRCDAFRRKPPARRRTDMEDGASNPQ